MSADSVSQDVVEVLKAIGIKRPQSTKHHHRDVDGLRSRVTGKLSRPLESALREMERKRYIPNRNRPELTKLGCAILLRCKKDEAEKKGYCLV